MDRRFALFDRPGLAGLALAEAIVTPSEERALIASIDGVELSPFRFPGWLGKRLTASYGWRYNFDTGSFGPADPIPDWLLPLREKAAGFSRLAPDDLVQALVIRYDPGAGIGWHRERPVFEHVIPRRCGQHCVADRGGSRCAPIPSAGSGRTDRPAHNHGCWRQYRQR